MTLWLNDYSFFITVFLLLDMMAKFSKVLDHVRRIVLVTFYDPSDSGSIFL